MNSLATEAPNTAVAQGKALSPTTIQSLRTALELLERVDFGFDPQLERTPGFAIGFAKSSIGRVLMELEEGGER